MASIRSWLLIRAAISGWLACLSGRVRLDGIYPLSRDAVRGRESRDGESTWEVGMKRAGGYQGGYLIGFIIIGAVALRDIIFYQSNLMPVIPHLAIYGLLYILDS